MRLRSVVALSAALLLLAAPTALDSCAISPPEPVFMTRTRPANLEEFVQGKLGIILSSYDRRYLIVAFRILSGHRISQDEADALISIRQAGGSPYSPSGLSAWLAARNTVPGIAAIQYIDVYKSQETPGSLNFYQNCLDDAFAMASATLSQHIKDWGAGSPLVREWAASQDQVFQNCAGKTPTIPAAPSAELDRQLVADRQYQVAAASFYAGQWNEARLAFELVAANAQSPWRRIAPYLIARVYLREGMVEQKPDALAEAERRFTAIADDPEQAAWHDASLRMLDFTGFRLHSWDRLKEYGGELAGEGSSDDLGQHLTDFLFLYEHAGDPEKLAATCDLSEWLLAIQGWRPESGKRALMRWRESHNQAWFIAALFHADDASDLDELLQPARSLKPEDPGFESAAYYSILALIRAGRRDEAREWVDRVLKSDLPLSARNRFLHQRVRLARTWNEFLRSAPRRAEPNVENYDNHEIPSPGARANEGLAFDIDASRILSQRVPIVLLFDATRNPALTKPLQAILAQSGFVRCAILGRITEAKAFLQRAVELQPNIAGATKEFLSADDPQAAHFAAILLMMRSSAPNPIVQAGWSEPSDLHRSRNPGDIRWGFHEAYFGSDQESSSNAEPPPLEFLTAMQRKQAGLEWKELRRRASCGATYLEREGVNLALKYPNDPGVPEALYYVVRATFKGCGSISGISKQAYTLLKERYPESEWAKKTKYWYR